MNLRIILSALLWDGEHVVGFAYGDEAGAGCRVIAVAIGVIFFGEGVKLALYFCRGRSRAELECFVVVWQRTVRLKTC